MPATDLVAKLPVVLHPGDDGWIVAECPLIPGCISQGRNRTEALENILEAIELCLETQAQEGWALATEYEVVELDRGTLRSILRVAEVRLDEFVELL